MRVLVTFREQKKQPFTTYMCLESLARIGEIWDIIEEDVVCMGGDMRYHLPLRNYAW